MTELKATVAAGVQHTLASYAHALDAGRTDDVVALFAPDGSAEIPGFGRFEGHDELRAAYAQLVPAAPQLHMVGNVVVTDVDGDEASAVSAFTMFLRGDSGWSVAVTGGYDDLFRRSAEGAWLIARRSMTVVM